MSNCPRFTNSDTARSHRRYVDGHGQPRGALRERRNSCLTGQVSMASHTLVNQTVLSFVRHCMKSCTETAVPCARWCMCYRAIMLTSCCVKSGSGRHLANAGLRGNRPRRRG